MYCAVKNSVVYVYATDGRTIRELHPHCSYGTVTSAQITGDEVAVQCQKGEHRFVLLYNVDGRLMRQTSVR